MDQLLILPAQQRVSPSLLESLKRSGWRTTVTEDMVQAKQLLQRGGISGIIVEIAPQGHDPERMKLLRFVREFCPDTTVIILHSEGTIAEGLADEKLVQELDSLDRASAQIASSSSSTSYRLTPSQKRIAELVSQAYPNREIARLLKIKEQSVRNELSRIFRKTGVWNRVELALLMRGDPAPDAEARKEWAVNHERPVLEAQTLPRA